METELPIRPLPLLLVLKVTPTFQEFSKKDLVIHLKNYEEIHTKKVKKNNTPLSFIKITY